MLNVLMQKIKPMHGLVVAAVISVAAVSCTSQRAAPGTSGASTRLHHMVVKAELVNRPHVQVWGFVRNPGVYPWQPGMTVGDLIRAAGGTTALAAGIRMRHDVALVTYLGTPDPKDKLWREPLCEGDEIDVGQGEVSRS
jgi:hypothetical protein